MDEKDLITFILDGKPFQIASILYQSSIAQVRALLKLDNNIKFTLSGISLNLSDEAEIEITAICDGNIIQMVTESQEVMNAYLNGSFFQSFSDSRKTTLDLVRKQLNIKETIEFKFNQLELDKIHESTAQLKHISMNGKTIHSQTNKLYSQQQQSNFKALNQQQQPLHNKTQLKKNEYMEIQMLYVKKAIDMIETIQDHQHPTQTQLDNLTYSKDKFQSYVKSIKDFELRAKICCTINDITQTLQKYQVKGIKPETKDENYLHIIVSDNRQKKAVKVKNEPINGSKLICTQKGLDIYQYPITIVIQEIDKRQAKVIMVVGQTGSGKSTLLNSLINYHMGVEFSDPFRYIVIAENTGKSQAHSQTDNITQYYIRAHGERPSLIIVDTPGFGDTRGIQYDEQLVGQIKEYFDKKMDQIHSICFVASASNARLTACQKYIFNEVLKLFGKDIAENFICMITFCDGSEPPILEGFLSTESPFREVQNLIKEPWYMKFNNSGIFQGQSQDVFQNKMTQMFWDISMHSFEEFYKLKVQMLPVKSLTLTKEVLKTRENLKVRILDLNVKNNFLIQCQQSINDQIVNVRNNQGQIDANSNFDVTVTVPQITRTDLEQGQYVTNCVICNYSCHYPCSRPDDNQKIGCAAMVNGKCQVCKGGCDWSDHKNMSFRFETSTITKTERAQNVFKAYLDAKGDMSNSELIIQGLQIDLDSCKIEFSEIQHKVNNLVDLLQGSALRLGIMDSCDDYIDEMILVYQDERKQGWEKSVQSLKDQKKYNKLLQQSYAQQSTIKQFGSFLKSKRQQVEKLEKSWFNQVFS